MLEDEETLADLTGAMYKDTHKDSFEGWMQEINIMQHDLYNTLDHLEEWMQPEKRATNLFNAPAWSQVNKDPLGVALIIGAWNYNTLLTLQPMIGAIAAGNCTILKPGNYAEHSCEAIQRAVEKYMDPECIQVVQGDRHVTATLLECKFDIIFFTGSASVGRIIAAGPTQYA